MRHDRRSGTPLAIVWAALVLASATPAFAFKAVRGRPDDFPLLAAERARIAAGGITVRHRGIPGTQLNEFYSAGYVEAPVNEVFAFYENYRNTPKFQDSIERISEIAQRGRYRQLEYWLDLPFPIGHRHFVLDLAGDGVPGRHGAIWWSLDRGDIRQMQGSYVVEALGPDRTLVKYHVIADMKTWLPSWLVGFVQGGTIPNVIRAARKDCPSAGPPQPCPCPMPDAGS